MRSRLLRYVEPTLLNQVAIHISRPKEIYDDVPNILWCHDLAEDSAVNCLFDTHEQYAYFVFVSYWQRDQFINRFNLPYSKCIVIQNAIETEYDPTVTKATDIVNFIYHTTPHRGLELVYPIFDALCKKHDNIHLNVYSSFAVYGWEHRDEPYQELFQRIEEHPHMTYHGSKSNDEVLDALKKAHVFLYPSIWKETSCISLIEAVVSGCVSVYPSYGALPETGTAASNIGMYDYSEKMSENASRAYELCDWLLNQHKEDSQVFRHMSSSTVSLFESPHSIKSFKRNWDFLLNKVIKGK